MKVIIYGLQIVLGAGDDPIRHGRSADTDSKKFKSLLLPVQRKRVCIFFGSLSIVGVGFVKIPPQFYEKGPFYV